MSPPRLTAAAVAALTSACVRVDPGPNGIASARLDGAPPSIVAGDVLRDATGAATALRAVAFDESGREVPTAPVRFLYVPTLRDTLNRPVADAALAVDSLTGLVTAAAAFTLAQGLVAVRVGSRLQLLDTLAIVPTPRFVTRDTSVDTLTLRYDCADTARGLLQRPLAPDPRVPGLDTAYVFNAVGPFRVRVFGDSLTTDSLPVRRRLVRWSVDTAPPIPSVVLPGTPASSAVPAVAIVSDSAAGYLTADTTDATGRSGVRVRIQPTALKPGAFPETARVVLRATVQRGPVPVVDSVWYFPVRLARRPGASCP